MKLRSENNLTSQPGVLIEKTIPLISLENILLIVGRRWKPLKPFLSDVDLALGGAGVDLLQAV